MLYYKNEMSLSVVLVRIFLRYGISLEYFRMTILIIFQYKFYNNIYTFRSIKGSLS